MNFRLSFTYLAYKLAEDAGQNLQVVRIELLDLYFYLKLKNMLYINRFLSNNLL